MDKEECTDRQQDDLISLNIRRDTQIDTRVDRDGHKRTHRQRGDHISLLSFFSKTSK
jgi:hypothetical protein